MRWLWTLAFGLALWSLTHSDALADKRVALVIGNGAYAHAEHLSNPPHDAEDVAAALKRSGFETIVGVDLDKAKMDDAAIEFARAARTADVAVFYYSGHAMQFAGVNYLVPVDAKLTDEADLRRMARVDEIVADLQQAKTLRILVLDSCRNNPLAEQLKRSIGANRALSIQRGLAKIDSPEGMIVSYATQAGSTAEDGIGHNSPYTAAFLKHIEEQDEIGTIFRRIAADVYESTRREQLPELSLSFIGEFYLRGRLDIAAPARPPVPDPCASAESHWKSAEAIGSLAAFDDHLARFPSCIFAGLAKARIESLKNKEAKAAPPAATPDGTSLQEHAPDDSRSPARCSDEQSLKSVDARRPTGISFKNSRDTSIRIFWIDYAGKRKLYGSLSYGQSLSLQTFMTHPWVITNNVDTCIGVYLPETPAREFVIR
ncbi:MAG: caspase family protein [Beijerinckiaceae bacterium]